MKTFQYIIISYNIIVKFTFNTALYIIVCAKLNQLKFVWLKRIAKDFLQLAPDVYNKCNLYQLSDHPLE